jgi:dienelactone hydrolase
MTSSAFRFTERPGPHAVGLRVVEQYDYSRPFGGTTDALGRVRSAERSRPLQTLVWYPAEKNTAKRMTVGEYVNLWATETRFGKPGFCARAREWLSAMRPTLDMSLWAARDVPQVAARFPVVIYAPSHSNPSWENADLCEYLATHGYVVIASASMGASTRAMTTDLSGIDAQARDISFLVGYAQSLANANVAKIAVAGFSWGGISNVFAAARDDRIGALIALDGSLRFSPGLVQKAGDVHPGRMRIPLLSIAQGQWTPEDRALLMERYPDHEGPDVLNAWTHGDLVTVHMLGLSHLEHSSMLQRNEDAWWNLLNVYRQKRADFGREDGAIGYAWLARYTRAFLDAYFKDDEESLAFLKRSAVENGAPRHCMAVRYRAATGVAVSFDTFRSAVCSEGFVNATDVFSHLKDQKPDFHISEEILHAWADDLVDEEHLREALAILKLNVQLHPQSSMAHTGLGNIYRLLNRSELALQSFARALELDPLDGDASRMLKELERNVALLEGQSA